MKVMKSSFFIGLVLVYSAQGKVFSRVQSGICNYEPNDGQPNDVVEQVNLVEGVGWRVTEAILRTECKLLCAEESDWCKYIAFEDNGQEDHNSASVCYLFDSCSPRGDDDGDF